MKKSVRIECGSNSPPLEGCPQGGVVYTRPGKCPENPVLTTNSESDTTNSSKFLYINSIPIKMNPILDLACNPALKKRAKELRQAKNLPEVLFWMQVTKSRFHKIDFDRQRVIGNYIVDFYVKKLGLVIEIDGDSHIGKEDYDEEREKYLCSLGLKVYRIEAIDVLRRMDRVMQELENYLIEYYGDL